VLDKAVAAGANSIYGVGFGHNDPSALLDKARPLAVADARRKADIYATAAGARIGRLMVLTEEPGRPPIVSFLAPMRHPPSLRPQSKRARTS
jgi:uncharacterized protein